MWNYYYIYALEDMIKTDGPLIRVQWEYVAVFVFAGGGKAREHYITAERKKLGYVNIYCSKSLVSKLDTIDQSSDE